MEYTDEAAHAGSFPEQGRNAMQAMATAMQNLYAVPRYSEGLTRSNVGKVSSDNPTNIISEAMSMHVEVRAGTTTVNDHMRSSARRVIENAAEMHDVSVAVDTIGRATTNSRLSSARRHTMSMGLTRSSTGTNWARAIRSL